MTTMRQPPPEGASFSLPQTLMPAAPVVSDKAGSRAGTKSRVEDRTIAKPGWPCMLLCCGWPEAVQGVESIGALRSRFKTTRLSQWPSLSSDDEV